MHTNNKSKCLLICFLFCQLIESGGLSALAGKRDGDTKTMHFIYTVGCDEFQVIAAVALDNSWKEVKNRGRLTRIVGGCDNQSQQEFLKTSPLSGDPDYSVFFADGNLTMHPMTGTAYPARARPHSIEMWLNQKDPTEDIVVILDPDMVFMRPLSEHPSMRYVRPGFMLAQQYAHGDTWIKFAEAGEETPSISLNDAWSLYATGPPWALHISDLKRMLPDWKRYTDAQKGDGLMREQNAFNMAAYKHRIPSSGSTNLMVSEPGAWTEAWGDLSSPEFSSSSWSPYVLHYCHVLEYKTWQFQKSLFSHGWYAEKFHNSLPTPISCGAPLPEEPPAVPTEAEEPDAIKRQHAFMLAELLPRLSRAFKATRAKYCGAEDYSQVGLVRTMQPDTCIFWGSGKAQTRYLVSSASKQWDSVLFRGKTKCSPENQM
jgi:hypothetical protein